MERNDNKTVELPTQLVVSRASSQKENVTFYVSKDSVLLQHLITSTAVQNGEKELTTYKRTFLEHHRRTEGNY